MPSPQFRLMSNDLLSAAECLRAIAHPVRLRIIHLLTHGDYTVGELAEACDIPSAMTSEHLRLMQHSGLLASERQGRKVFYKVCEPFVSNLLKCLDKRYGFGA